MVTSQNTAAIARATGRPWDAWLEELDGAGAREMDHPQITGLAIARMPESLDNPGWWAQGVAVAYEQHHGMRVPGQTSDGMFQASASKTFRGTRDEAWAAWTELVADREEFNGVGLAQAPTTSETPKWRYWRVSLEDGTRVSVGVTPKGDERATVGLEHAKLGSPEEIDRWKPFWKALLAEL